MDECDRCGARTVVIDSVDGKQIGACGWFCWARLRFGADIGWRTAVEKAKEHNVQPNRAVRYANWKRKQRSENTP